MITYPEYMRKAQEELDQVVGRDRLPTFKDREKLPYVRAVVSEVLRWRPSAPLGVSSPATLVIHTPLIWSLSLKW